MRREAIVHPQTVVDAVLQHQVGRQHRARGLRRPVAEAEAPREARGAVGRAEAEDTRMLQHQVTTEQKQVRSGGALLLHQDIHHLPHTRLLHHRPPLLRAPHQVQAAAMEEAGAVVQREVVGTN